ncbi:LacI family DNA-binding transcriptional regulator [Microbacterium tumbae]
MGTRREVAEAAQVSLRTVSNVVNGFAHVAEPTRARVLQAIADLDYRPSEIARSLKRGRSGLVGLVLPELDTPYFAELTRAFVEEGARRGMTVVIDQTDGDIERERYLIDRTVAGSLFDALVISPLALAPDDLAAVDPARPIIFLGENSLPRFDRIAIDNVAAARDAVTHLATAGRRRIAAIGAQASPYASSELRLRGYREALMAAGLGHAGLVEEVLQFRRADGADAMERLLARSERPDAVFCFSDLLALGAHRALHLHGLRIPTDIAVVGFDDIEDGAYATPSLTTIRPDRSFIARTALDRIEARLGGTAPAAALITAPHELVIRESSGSD